MWFAAVLRAKSAKFTKEPFTINIEINCSEFSSLSAYFFLIHTLSFLAFFSSIKIAGTLISRISMEC